MISDDLQRLFEAERAARPPADELERGLSRLLADVARDAAPLPVAATSLKLALPLASKALAVGFLVGLVGAGAAARIGASGPVAAPSAPQHAASATSVAANITRPLPDMPMTSDTSLPVASEARSERAVPSSLAGSPATDTGHLSEELRLIAAAKRDLEGGRSQLAAAWLAEHAARFPRGVFATDREALTILLQCESDKSEARARQFATQHPSSPLTERVLRACAPGATRASSSGHFSESDK